MVESIRYLVRVAGASYLPGVSKQEACPELISPLGTASDPSDEELLERGFCFLPIFLYHGLKPSGGNRPCDWRWRMNRDSGRKVGA